MDKEERSALGDAFDKVVRALDGRPDVVKTKAATVRASSKILERTQTFIIQTYRVKDEGDTILVEYIGQEGSFRIPLPPIVADTIARQYDALSGKSRRKAAKMLAADRKARGIVPGFQRQKGGGA